VIIGGTVTVSDEEVNLLNDNGILVVDLKQSLDKVKNGQIYSGTTRNFNQKESNN
jgi:hypothetical protein